MTELAEYYEMSPAGSRRRRSGKSGNRSTRFLRRAVYKESAREAMKEETMRAIAHDLSAIVRRDAKTDWQVKESVRAKLRTSIKRLLLKHGYPPDQEPRRPT